MYLKVSEDIKKLKISNPKEVYDIFSKILFVENKEDSMKEHLWCIGFNCRNQISYIELVSLGTLNASLVHPRELYKTAILKSVASIILCHNHPSEDITPSEDDIKLTRRLVECGELLGIGVLDHIIIANKCYCSMKDKGLI